MPLEGAAQWCMGVVGGGGSGVDMSEKHYERQYSQQQQQLNPYLSPLFRLDGFSACRLLSASCSRWLRPIELLLT